MFDQLNEVTGRLEEIMRMLSEPETLKDPELLQKLMKEQAALSPLVECYRKLLKAEQTVEDALKMLREESDEEMLQQYVGKNNAEVVIQGPKTFSDPMKQLRADYRTKRIVNDHNPIDEWCRMNVSEKRDDNDNIRPVKVGRQAKNRIDGFMSELDAYVTLMRHYDEYLNVI